MGSYLVLSALYAGYLKFSEGGSYAPDFITNLVAKQSSDIISGLGYKAIVVPSDTAPNMELYVNGKYLARIIEGCNAISIIILFMAFIIAFSEKFKKTLLFLLAGAVLIYAMNILRIVILAIALYEYPRP
jgi:Transmembrane exosortase (Exosortase_EpsH).